MATYQADQARAVAIELRNKITTLYVAALPIFRAAAQWTLNSLDTALPAAFALKVQIDAYKALRIEGLTLGWATTFQGAAPGDTLAYPTPPDIGGHIAFEQIAFTTVTF